MSASAITHFTPAAAWAAVGGQGKDAASAAASCPALSVPAAGGPVVPVCTTNGFGGRLPSAANVNSALNGFVQLTGTAGEPACTTTVGWLGSLLHSMTIARLNGA